MLLIVCDLTVTGGVCQVWVEDAQGAQGAQSTQPELISSASAVFHASLVCYLRRY